jgi:hypothetical protein
VPLSTPPTYAATRLFLAQIYARAKNETSGTKMAMPMTDDESVQKQIKTR